MYKLICILRSRGGDLIPAILGVSVAMLCAAPVFTTPRPTPHQLPEVAQARCPAFVIAKGHWGEDINGVPACITGGEGCLIVSFGRVRVETDDPTVIVRDAVDRWVS